MVILGAGASYDSYGSWVAGRQPLDRPQDYKLAEDFRPPLTKDLFTERPPVNTTTRVLPECAGWVGHMRQLLRAHGDGRAESVEEILASFADSADPNLSKRATLAIRLFMQHMLMECQNHWSNVVTSHVTNYGTLVVNIAVAGITEACFVSFNYDTLFEQALPNIGVTLTTLDSYIAHASYKVVKPHGSLNWSHKVRSRVGVNAFYDDHLVAARWLIANAPDVDPSPDFTVFPSPQFASHSSLAEGLWPAIALPIASKTEFECPDPHMNALDACVPKVSKLLTIGWRGAERHFLKRFAGKLPRTASTLVVGRDRKDAADIAVRLKGAGLAGRFQSAEGGFTDSLREEIPAFLK